MLRNGYRAGRMLSVPSSASQVFNSTAAMAAEMDKSWEKAKPYEEIPGPRPVPIIGNLYQFIPGIAVFFCVESYAARSSDV
ncbi:hypothetical protein J437_LFUL019431 [Ladona fulva]|uniref:Uncharacterized protein n=1 Tax=Ladona fulva TaxID=123851 RepID=A0A8K0KS75_LADFU|nr:hypothetical protein J437_LFUL019431 [Ladona fulva]